MIDNKPKENCNEGAPSQPTPDVGLCATRQRTYIESLYSERDYLENNLKKVNDKIHLLEGNKFLREFADKLFMS